MPKHFRKNQPQLGIRKITSNTVPDTYRPGLECCPIVIYEHGVCFVEMSLGDEFKGLGEVVVGEVSAQMADSNSSLGLLATRVWCELEKNLHFLERTFRTQLLLPQARL